MLGGREKIGQSNFDWQQQMLRKHARRTIGFGKYDKKEREYPDELYIREISIVDAGLGCALWDGGIILTRWIHKHLELFRGATVLELGAGCGLPGILTARVSRSTIMTDYMESIIDNIRYNIWLNSHLDDEDTEHAAEWLGRCCERASRAWAAGDIDAARAALEELPDDPAAAKLVLRAAVGRAAHGLFLDWEDCESVAIEPVDVIIGAELTYSLLNVSSLVRVVSRFLKPDGVFYEILSNDRDGVPEFVRQIGDAGFTVDAVPVPRELMGSYGTSPWTFQDVETYTCYTFRRTANPRWPRME
eukprot:a13756_24.p2 GENE.a13756_24~~a13756_24.p2  ORF type:complete len:315 (+),score=95.32 a13756_24:38-946(+)